MLHRQPVSMGKLYSSGFDMLNKEIEQSFLHAEGPGELPIRRTTQQLLGILAPYGNYRDVGHLCAWAYKEIAESQFPDVFVIIGKGGTEYGFFTSLFSGWKTPFGIVDVDKEKGQELIKLFPDLKNDYTAFEQGAAIEAQLPFLQFANRDKLNDVRILPILVNSLDYPKCQALGEAIADLRGNGRICVIGSCTLYGDLVDTALVDALKRMDTKKILDIAQVNAARGDIVVFTEALKHLFARRGRLLHYQPGAAALSFLLR